MIMIHHVHVCMGRCIPNHLPTPAHQLTLKYTNNEPPGAVVRPSLRGGGLHAQLGPARGQPFWLIYMYIDGWMDAWMESACASETIGGSVDMGWSLPHCSLEAARSADFSNPKSSVYIDMDGTEKEEGRKKRTVTKKQAKQPGIYDRGFWNERGRGRHTRRSNTETKYEIRRWHSCAFAFPCACLTPLLAFDPYDRIATGAPSHGPNDERFGFFSRGVFTP